MTRSRHVFASSVGQFQEHTIEERTRQIPRGFSSHHEHGHLQSAIAFPTILRASRMQTLEYGFFVETPIVSAIGFLFDVREEETTHHLRLRIPGDEIGVSLLEEFTSFGARSEWGRHQAQELIDARLGGGTRIRRDILDYKPLDSLRKQDGKLQSVPPAHRVPDEIHLIPAEFVENELEIAGVVVRTVSRGRVKTSPVTTLVKSENVEVAFESGRNPTPIGRGPHQAVEKN